VEPVTADALASLAAGLAVLTGAALAYSFAVYPLVLRLAARRPAPPVPAGADSDGRREVSVVLVVKNEAARLRRRVEDLLAQAGEVARLEIVLVVDRSADATADVARELAAECPAVQAHILGEGETGKACGINLGVARARAPLVVFCDARQSFRPGSLGRLVAAFAEPGVGAVTGVVRPAGDGHRAELVAAYRRYDDRLRELEARVDSAVQCAGAISAVRRSLFVPLPAGLILDDMWVPQQVVRQGYRVAVAPGAVADDPLRPTFREELRRKARTLAGNFQLAREMPGLLTPAGNPRLWWMVWSHKYLRLLVPVFSAACILAGLFSADPWLRGLGALVALGLVAGAAIAWACRERAIDSVGLPLRLAGSVFLANASIVAAAASFASGAEAGLWRR
jgi:cellulose synthase/poly-beta-1,6-N-acetylglucosamine synthase-like glycosyltransferase